MAINERLVHTASAAGNQEEGLILHLDANDVDSYDGDGDVWYDIHDHEYTPATKVSEHFNTVTYTGNSSTNAITGVGFEPDLVWIKNRDDSLHHYLTDSVRGEHKILFTSSTSQEYDGTSDNDSVDSFDSDGFTLQNGTNAANYNQSTKDYVAWCFNAGGNEVTNTNGDHDSTVRANNDLGFSIVKGSGSGTGVQTVGHGLDSAPEMVIIKNIAVTDNWWVYHSATGVGKYLQLNTRNATANWSDNMVVNSTEIGVRQNSTGSWGNLIAYCFTSKRGVSKVGSYIGNGTTNNKIYTGFEPAFFMLKNTSLDNTGWLIKDNVRGENSKTLLANSSAIEYNTTSYWTCDFERDGVRLTYGADNEFNRNGDTYIFYAVAKDTNETSLHTTDLELNLEADSYSGSGDWLDSSGNGNNGTINGAAHDAELGDFFEFDGTNDTIEIGSSMYKSLPMTVEAWVNPLLTDNSVIYSNYDSSAIKGFYIRVNTSGQIFVDAYSNPSGTYQRTTTYSSEYLTANKWSHVAVTFTTSYVKVYVNGESSGQSSTNANGITFTPSFSTLIGARGGTSDEFYGKIGQVRAYSSELSLTQIRQNFNFTKPKYPNEFHGDINGATWNASGYFDFDGSNDKVSITSTGTSPINFKTKNYTISAWINPDTSGINQIFTKYGSSDSLRSVSVLIHSDNTLRLLQRTSTSDNSYSTSTIPQNTWTHVAVARSSSDVKFYINGQLDNTVSNTFTPNSGGSQDILIGANSSGTPSYFNGQISKVRAYNTALTQAEITTLYTEGQ